MKLISVIESNLNAILEGGNLSWKDEQGKDKSVERIDLNNISREDFSKEILSFVSEINSAYKNKFKEELIKKENIGNPNLYSGSTRPLLRKDISTSEFVKYKKTIGDVDFQVPELKKENIKELLLSKPQLKGFTIDFTKDAGNQMITAVTSKALNKTFQVDFEFSEFIDDLPSAWSIFSHASDWEDMKKGMKGFLKQYLLRSILRSKKTDAIIQDKKGNKKKEVVHLIAYSVDRGFREKYKKIGTEGGLPVLVELNPDNSTYSKNIDQFYKILFPNAKSIDGDSLQSFINLVTNIKQNNLPAQEIFDEFFDLLFGKGAQKMDRLSKMNDFKPKISGIKMFKEKIPAVKLSTLHIQKIKKYYKGYAKK